MPSRILRICLVGATAVVLAAPAGARVLPVQTVEGSTVAQYGWGAAATFAKQQKRAHPATRALNDLLAQYGWGAAATYAKLHA